MRRWAGLDTYRATGPQHAAATLTPTATATRLPKPPATCPTGRGASPNPISGGSAASKTHKPTTAINAIARPE